MDPNEALEAIRKLVQDMEAWEESGEDPDEPGEYYRIASELATAFDGLDGWLSKGGFRPEAWTQHLPPEERRTLAMERRAHRLREALQDAGVPRTLIHAIELGKPVELPPKKPS